MKYIISVSRRSDVPAFYSGWFLNALKSGYTTIKHPFNHNVLRINLTPNEVLGFVFWSRYPKGLISILEFIDNSFGSNHYINFTLNDYPEEIEPRKPNLEKVLYLVNFLYDKYGENYIKWRFDPIVISNLTTKYFVIEKFNLLSKLPSGKVRSCIVSFLDLYGKVKRRISSNGKFILKNIEFDEQVELISQLAQIASMHNIELKLCCERSLAKALNIKEASCVNPNQFTNQDDGLHKMAPTRKGCTCFKSYDIGFYNTCLFNCIYCYANTSYESSLRNYKIFKKEELLDSNKSRCESPVDKVFKWQCF
ncbi:MAG: DUF1848 family protein [Candidatus Kapaibacteriota bacterium]